VDFGPDSSDLSEVAVQQQTGTKTQGTPPIEEKLQYEYEILNLKDQRYLCQIPQVELPVEQNANDTLSKADEEKELARANERGWALLKEMEGNCIYFWSGWWSYRYCYGEGVKQFHQLPPTAGTPMYPPVEDTAVTPFMLGKVEEVQEPKKQEETGLQAAGGGDATAEVSSSDVLGHLETRGDARYLVQKLSGGTTCDLTGKPRRVEVQVISTSASPW
jgi:protein OS-9